ncbi:hypothetical protein FGIG_04995 [Fasciola gigantica]|uniref:Basal body-orientation factor 1 n=1 Tax=Fasciola gigantica TaxID=46835 RepID=A0A504YGD2_FASGI|nr:hypothetical protein FGIG_04995 [Fasciola gigantica]
MNDRLEILRERVRRLNDENYAVSDLLEHSEKDSLEVFGTLKKNEEKKDREIYALRKELCQTLQSQKEEKGELIVDLERSLQRMEENVQQKDNDIQSLQSSLKNLQDFMEERDEYQSELRHLKEELKEEETRRNDLLEKMELKFFEEKMRIRKEALQNIQMLALEAHRAALANLSSSVKSVYKQNVDMRMLLKHFRDQLRDMTANSMEIKNHNQHLILEKKTLECLLHKLKADYKKSLQKLTEHSHREAQLEQRLARTEQEFAIFRKTTAEAFNNRELEVQKSIETSNRIVQLERKRTARVYALANRILEHRSDVEQFFLSSLEEVRDEIVTTQANYKQDAKAAYNTRLRLAYYGAADYPQIRTFQPGLPSTNTVYDDLKAADCMPSNAKVQFSELTWEQKERVLANLFARINAGRKVNRRSPSRIESIPVLCTPIEMTHHSKETDSSVLSISTLELEKCAGKNSPLKVSKGLCFSAPGSLKSDPESNEDSHSLPELRNVHNLKSQMLLQTPVEQRIDAQEQSVNLTTK